MTTSQGSLTPPAMGTSERPEPPIQVAGLVLPLLAAIAAYTLAGLLGSQAILWGLLIGAVTAGFVWWRNFVQEIPWLVAIVVAGPIATSLFSSVLRSRTTVIEKGLSSRASLSWLLFGLVVGLAMSQASRPRLPGIAIAARSMATALAFGLSSFLALQAGTSIGYIEALRGREIDGGAIQFLTTGFYVQAGAILLALGLAAAVALRLRNGVLFAGASAVVMTLVAVNQINFSVKEILSSFTRLGALAGEFWPPDWAWPKTIGQPEAVHIFEPFIETLQIAVIGATLGCIIAVPLAFSASRATAPNYPTYWFSKAFMNVFRTIPDLFWGILFATAVGFGSPFAGALAMIMFSLSIMAKLLSETVDSIDVGPLEAAKSAGARHWQMVQYAAYPQVAPNYVAYALYIFELNIRASVVLGIVGAGGIGRLLDERRNFFQWDQVMAIVMVIFVAVILIEIFSIWVRKKIV
ncbi:MAG: phosphonate ABC transporter, permease protein PhnE [bacterium]|nr:phosphonate ABC transporter, permease protein PhnE [bacterium]